MPNQVVPKGDDGDSYAWLHIDDFTPGLFTANATSESTAAAATNYTPQPLGSASAVEGCFGQPNGGLVPLPWYSEAPRDWPFGSVTGIIFIVGVESNTARHLHYLMTGDAEETELIVVSESEQSGSHVFEADSYVIETSAANNIITSTSAVTGAFWGAPYPQWTRVSAHGLFLYPVLVFPSVVPTDSQGDKGHMYVYPDLASPTSFAAEDIVAASVTAGVFTGQLITYDGRIMGITTPTVFAWPGAGTPLFTSNETIQYTDPPISNLYFPSTDDTADLVPENPFGYGAVGSISAGELFLVKKRGGGVLMLGDIDAPSSVTYLPGVQPTGDFYGKGESTQLGFVYCAEGFGAWVWNGANVSQKISSQLEDNFFDAATHAAINSKNVGFFVKRWGDFILFSNNYLYSILTQSWWQLTPPALNNEPYYHYVDARNDHQIYALPLKITDAEQTTLYTFDTRVGAPHYEWTSTELYRHLVTTEDRRIDIREVVVKASVNDTDPTGYTVICNIISNETIVATQTSQTDIGQDPTTILFNFGAKGLQNVKLKFLCDSNQDTPGSSKAAPTIWSFEVAYRTRTKNAPDQ